MIVLTMETRMGSVAMENNVDIATMRLARPESRLNLVAKSAQEAATGAPNITASVTVWLLSSHGMAMIKGIMTAGMIISLSAEFI